MSKRGQVDLVANEHADSPHPVRRSSRISSGQNLTSSPAPKTIKTRRNSANSVAEKEKSAVEANSTTEDKRKTRRASTDEDPKPAPIRGRRSSVTKVIEQEITSAPNSPSRRTTRAATASPSLEVPARRTRRSSQDTETTEIPARRTTRRSSTGIQESTIEEIIEKAKPITRRRRSSSIDEQEENVVAERPKTKRLFNEDNHLEPIKEQDQEVKEKAVVETNKEVSHTLEVIEELGDDESDRLIESLSEVIGEEDKIEIEDEAKTAEEDKTIPTELNKTDVEKERIETEEKSSPKKCILETSRSEKAVVEVKTQNSTDAKLPEEKEPRKSIEKTEPKLSAEEEKSEAMETSEKVDLVKNPETLLRNYIEVGEDGSYALTLKGDNKIQVEKTKNEQETLSSPGSDKENASINIPKKRISSKFNEDNSAAKNPEQDAFVVRKTPRNSLCEPMDVDEDEDDLFSSKTETPKLMNGKSETKITSPITSQKEEELTSSKDNSCTMEGSFSHVNVSPDKESPMLDKTSESQTEIKDSTTTEDNDCDSDASIKLVDTDDEENARKENETATNEIDTEIQNSQKTTDENDKTNASLSITEENKCDTSQAPGINVSELDESVLDKSFESDKEVAENFNDTLVEANSSIKIVVEAVDSTNSNETTKDQLEKQESKRKSLGEAKTNSNSEVESPTDKKDQTAVESEKKTVEVKENGQEGSFTVSGNESSHKSEKECVDSEIAGSPQKSSTKVQNSREKDEKNESDTSSDMELLSRSVKWERESNNSENEVHDSQNSEKFLKYSIKMENQKMISPLDQSPDTSFTSGDVQFKVPLKAEKVTPTRKSVGKEIEEENASKSGIIQKIILQRIEVIKHTDDELLQRVNKSKLDEESDTSEDQELKLSMQPRTRHSFPNVENDKKTKKVEAQKTESRRSVPMGHSKYLKVASSSTESLNEDERNEDEKDDEIHLILSSDDEKQDSPEEKQDSTKENLKPSEELNSSTKKNDSMRNEKYDTLPEESEKETETESNKNSPSENEDEEECLPKKRKSEESGGKRKKLKVCPEELSDSEHEVDESNEEEDNEQETDEIEDEKTTNKMKVGDFLDDMAEEGEETPDEEESDENEIIDEGESVLSSSMDEKSSEDDYDSKDSFICDDDPELLSGEEEYLGIDKKEKKKYKKIIAPSCSDSDDVFEDLTENSPETEKPAETREELVAEKIDSILKVNPARCSSPNLTVKDVMNSSRISESSVILQETCSIGAAKSKVIINKINCMVDVFCQNIHESEGDISLNVSLNYKPPQGSPRKSLETRESLNISLGEDEGTKEVSKIVEKSPVKPSRLSMEKRKLSLSPKKPSEDVSKIVEKSPGKSPRLSMENKKVSPSPRKPTEDVPKIVGKSPEKPSRLSMEKKKLSLSPKKSAVEKLIDVVNVTSTDKDDNTDQVNLQNESQWKDIDDSATEKVEKPKKKKKKSRKQRSIERKAAEEARPNLDETSSPAESISKNKNGSTEEIISCEDVKSNKTAKQKGKKKKGKVLFDLGEQDVPKTKKTEIEYNEKAEKNKDFKIKGMKRKADQNYEVTLQVDIKKGKRKNTEPIDKEVPVKQTKLHNNQFQIETKRSKELKPTKPSSCLKNSEKNLKNKKVLKASYLNQGSEWEEEKVVVQPSAANTSLSGFNLEALLSRDFKNRMIYDSSRNKRETSVKSKKKQKY